MLIVTGNTFPHRETLKQLGGNWINNRWEFASNRHIDRIKKLVGCSVTDLSPSPAPVEDAIDKLIAADSDDDKKPKARIGKSATFGDDLQYFNHFKDKNPVAFFGFSSLGAMVEYVTENRFADRSGWRTDDTRWAGGTMLEAIRLTRDGWAEGEERARAVCEALSVLHAVKRRREVGLTGGHVSVGRMLSGNPKHMVRRAKLPSARVITLFVEMVAASYITAEILTIRAAAIAAICDTLENAGYSCEIISLCTVKNVGSNTPMAQSATIVKHAGQKLNLHDTSFALGHPAYLRRMHFACVASTELCHKIWKNQGCPSEAFNHHYPTAKNEFYIRHLPTNKCRMIEAEDTFIDKALTMIKFIEPVDLPIEIMR